MAAAVADDDAREVHGEKAAAVQQVGRRENQGAAGQDQQRIQPVGQRQPHHQPRQHPAPGQAEDGPEPELARQHPDETAERGGLGLQQRADHGGNEQDRHRIVGTGLDLQRGLDALVEADAAVAQEREHRGRIGRADDRREQHAQPPVDIEEPGGEHAEQGRRTDHAPAGQHRGRPQRHPEAAHPRAQAAVEQDHRERRLRDQRGDEEVLEDDAARPVLAGEHADAEEEQQQRQAEPGGDGAGEHADEQQQAGEQEERVDSGHAAAGSSRLEGAFGKTGRSHTAHPHSGAARAEESSCARGRGDRPSARAGVSAERRRVRVPPRAGRVRRANARPSSPSRARDAPRRS